MKKMKRLLISIACAICSMFICFYAIKYSWKLLMDYGYIPLTEEYDLRICMKNYKKNKEDFDLLINEISMYVDAMPLEWYDNCNFILFKPADIENTEWNIYIYKEYDRFEKKEQILNIKSIEKIENAYGEPLLDIAYFNDDNEYIFNIGDCYDVGISDGRIIRFRGKPVSKGRIIEE